MPNNRNAAKAARQAEKRRLRNRAAKTSLRTVIRKTREAITSGDPAKATAAVSEAASQLDRAATKKFIHRNKAARLKSRLASLAGRKPAAAPAAKP